MTKNFFFNGLQVTMLSIAVREQTNAAFDRYMKMVAEVPGDDVQEWTLWMERERRTYECWVTLRDSLWEQDAENRAKNKNPYIKED